MPLAADATNGDLEGTMVKPARFNKRQWLAEANPSQGPLQQQNLIPNP